MGRWIPQFHFWCRYCGRQWDTSESPNRGASGFIVSASSNHEAGCKLKTPAERRETNERDEKRWKRKPPLVARIWNDPNYHGLKDPK